jgi:hypothetical protein
MAGTIALVPLPCWATRTTSHPRSASSIDANGTAPIASISITRIPANGACIFSLFPRSFQWVARGICFG